MSSGASVRTEAVAASGRRRGQGGQLGDIPKATAPMKWMMVETVSSRSATDQGITETLQHSKS